MTLQNYRSRQVHGTLNGVNPSSGFRDMLSSESGLICAKFDKFLTNGQAHMGQMGKWQCTNYRPRQFHRTSNGKNPSSGYRDMGSRSLAAACPTDSSFMLELSVRQSETDKMHARLTMIWSRPSKWLTIIFRETYIRGLTAFLFLE